MNIAGSIVALVTPMTENGDIDEAKLRQLVDWQIESGSHGIVAVGTTGESPTLNVEEHLRTVRIIVEQAAGRVPVIAGNGANCTRESIELTLGAVEAGADACLCVVPYYNKPTQEGLYQHFKKISQCATIPQFLYNVPGRTVADLLPETVARLSEIPNIVGIKEATGDVERMLQIKSQVSDDFILLSGDDETFLDFMEKGGDGVISVTTNVAPEKMAQVCNAAAKGDFASAREVNESLLSLHRDLFVEANPIPVKWALARMNKVGETIRLPLTVLSEQYHETLESALLQAGCIA